MILNLSFSWWLNYQILISDQKLLPNVPLLTLSSLNPVLKNNCWLWLSMLKRMNCKLRNKNWSRNKTNSRLSWMNSNHHCWNNFHKPIQPQFWTIRNLSIIWKRLKQQLMKFNNNQKLPKLLKLILTHKEKSIVQLLLKVLCFISCVFLSASLTTCINIHLKVSLSSSLKPSKELLKKMRQELVS